MCIRDRKDEILFCREQSTSLLRKAQQFEHGGMNSSFMSRTSTTTQNNNNTLTLNSGNQGIQLGGTRRPPSRGRPADRKEEEQLRKPTPVLENPHRMLDDNFSQASFKTVESNITSATINSQISKNNIIYQKYAVLNDAKYKIIMLEIKDLNCIEIFIYSKPLNYLRKIFLYYQTILDFAKRYSKSDKIFESESDVEKMLNKLASLIYIQKGEVYLKDLEYYRSIEDVFKKHSANQVKQQQLET
eukprot:TRINITY_DN9405_c0_g1_i1.p1 TRINITY_DN9405_c0_g1~~TRINITY_DN9405_c0_g1_i1.p1  ORF type:complete len:244 (-),score=65.92 TRINITY_DN9405_c0_g1_i1:332-1063(-)